MEPPATVNDQVNNMFDYPRDTAGQVQAIKELFTSKDIKMKSHVNSKISEAEYFAKLFVLAELLNIKSLKKYALEVITLRVSNERRGRLEAVQMTKTVQEQEKKSGMWSWFGR